MIWLTIILILLTIGLLGAFFFTLGEWSTATSVNLARTVVGLAVIAYLSTALVPVGTGQVGVVTRFGQVTGRELGEGLNIKAPFPFEHVWIADIKVQKVEADVDAASQDLQTVSAKVALNYHLERGKVSEIYQTIGTDYQSRIIDPSVQETFKATTARYQAADLLTKRDEVKEASRQFLLDRLQDRGIVVDDLSIVNFNFSDAFNQAIEQKQVAQQDAERAKFRLEAAKTDAEAQAAQRESLTQEILTKQAIEKWDGHMPQYLGQNGVFGIPLSK